MSQNFELKKKGIKKIVVENTTCRIYGRKKKLRKKCPHFGHNIVLGAFFHQLSIVLTIF
jgi:hypothetical protein